MNLTFGLTYLMVKLMTPEEILKEQDITYTHKGKSLIVSCLNPKHEDTHPSMHIDKTLGIGHCFSCKATINVYTLFNKTINHLTIKQQQILDKIKILHPHKLNLPKDYNPFIEDFRNISKNTFKTFNMFTSEESEFAGRIVLPITNFKGNIIAFMGRYQHSNLDPKYRVVPKGAYLPLFPPSINIKDNTLVIVEGMFDLLNLYDKGIKNVITGFGLITPSKKDKYNVKLHERFITYKIAGISHIFILYDGDTPGRNAAYKLNEALEGFISSEIIKLEDDIDPGSMSIEDINKLKVMIKEHSHE